MRKISFLDREGYQGTTALRVPLGILRYEAVMFETTDDGRSVDDYVIICGMRFCGVATWPIA
jgi:hypothetical protein